MRMRRRKGGSGFGPSPLGWADFAGFATMTSISLSTWEVETLELVDDAYMAEEATRMIDKAERRAAERQQRQEA